MNLIIILASITIFLDQFIKIIVHSNMEVYHSISIIPNFFNITYVQNLGAAFSVLSGGRFILIVIALIALFLIYQFWIKGKKLKRLEKITYGLFIGGIIGNLFDRIIRGYVIDYLDFIIFRYDFPIFNLADMAIVISIILIIIMTLRGNKDERDNYRKRK